MQFDMIKKRKDPSTSDGSHWDGLVILIELDLRNCSLINDRCLQALINLTSLSKNVTGAAFSNMKKLAHLDIDRCENVSDDGIASITSLPLYSEDKGIPLTDTTISLLFSLLSWRRNCLQKGSNPSFLYGNK
ncbi:hypothetical protein AKO1_004861 [Acrasis kona]|uniref:Uncharacterized protein n=1 Tax=Acrasis kona TaxID=1008807 RepID=A0AAW2Z450_9EUKA